MDMNLFGGVMDAFKSFFGGLKKWGTDDPFMSGKRATEIRDSGHRCRSFGEAAMYHDYVKNRTAPNSMLRQSTTLENLVKINESMWNLTPLLAVIAVILIALLVYIHYFSKPLEFEKGATLMEKVENSQKVLFDTIEHVYMKPSGRAIITKKFKVSKNRDEIRFNDRTYKVADSESQEALWRIAPDKRIENMAILYFANYTLYVYDQFVETELVQYERTREGYYIYDELSNKAVRAYAAEGVNDGAFASHALIIKDTNVILQFE